MPAKRSRRAESAADQFQEALDGLQAIRKSQHVGADDLEALYREAAQTLRKLGGRVQRLERDLQQARAKAVGEVIDDKPTLESTTLWDYPVQSYGANRKGDSRYQGVTPAFIIYNMISRYTERGDLVLDPMCGSGTTIDVCEEEGREVIGYDINPVRDDIERNDARVIPLDDESVDMVFIDSPYGDNVDYSEHPENIGNLSAERDEFYDALQEVAEELYRVLKPGKVLGWLIGDQWVKRRFTPVGFNIYTMLTERVGFIPVDAICVTRRNQSSNTGLWHYRALKHNFYLRGYKHLFIVRKPERREVVERAAETIYVGVNRDTRDPESRSWRKYK